ncbi:MAG: nitroreductase family protein [Sporomusaceae bacterium]|nr:nitroreductase family protein [Sporomusaceae bacterium]
MKDNQVLETIRARYSCRSFSDKQVSDGDLRLIAEASLAAPSGRNRQPYRVIVVKDRTLIQEMNDAGMEVLSGFPDKSFCEHILICGLSVLPFAGAKGVEFKRRLGFPAGYDRDRRIAGARERSRDAPRAGFIKNQLYRIVITDALQHSIDRMLQDDDPVDWELKFTPSFCGNSGQKL